MNTTKVVRYTTTPETAPENERLIREVFAELAADRPEGFRYTALRLQGGQTFIHIATFETQDNPLSRSAAFSAFQERITERCTDGPLALDGAVLGSYPPLP